MDLHPEMGQRALCEAGLLEQFQKHSLPAAEAMKLVKSDGRVFWDENTTNAGSGHSGDRPKIDRARLRDILLDSIRPDSIQWNRKLVRVESTENPNVKYDLHFADGVEVGFDLVIGADGAWSKVRTLLTDQLPFYSGITVVELKALEVSTKKQWYVKLSGNFALLRLLFESRNMLRELRVFARLKLDPKRDMLTPKSLRLANFTGQGSCFMFDEGRAMVCQRNGNDSIRVYAAVRQPKTWVNDCGIEWDQRHLAQKIFAERYFGDCHDDLKRVIALRLQAGLFRDHYGCCLLV